MKESGCGRSDQGFEWQNLSSGPSSLLMNFLQDILESDRPLRINQAAHEVLSDHLKREYCPLIRPKPLPHHFLFWWCPKSNFLPAQSIVSRVKGGQRPKFDEILFFWNRWALNCGDYPNKLGSFQIPIVCSTNKRRGLGEARLRWTEI